MFGLRICRWVIYVHIKLFLPIRLKVLTFSRSRGLYPRERYRKMSLDTLAITSIQRNGVCPFALA